MLVGINERDRRAMLARKFNESSIEKALMPDFENVPQRPAVRALREEVEKSRKVVRHKFLCRMELPKNGPKPLSQFEYAAGEETLDRWPCLRQHRAVGGIARRLEREHEIIRRRGRPFAKAFRLLGAVEGAVDLDGGELAARIF